MMPTGSERLFSGMVLGLTFRRDGTGKRRSALARICIVLATWSNGSSTRFSPSRENCHHRLESAYTASWPRPLRKKTDTQNTDMPTLAIPFPAFDPVLIKIGPFAIRWYALAYIIGILAGWLYARALLQSQRPWGGPAPMKVIDFDDFILWVTLGIILGGRLGYVLFYNPRYFIENPTEAFQLWKGGMSFHGGFTA